MLSGRKEIKKISWISALIKKELVKHRPIQAHGSLEVWSTASLKSAEPNGGVKHTLAILRWEWFLPPALHVSQSPCQSGICTSVQHWLGRPDLHSEGGGHILNERGRGLFVKLYFADLGPTSTWYKWKLHFSAVQKSWISLRWDDSYIIQLATAKLKICSATETGFVRQQNNNKLLYIFDYSAIANIRICNVSLLQSQSLSRQNIFWLGEYFPQTHFLCTSYSHSYAC